MNRYTVLKDILMNEVEQNPTFQKPFKILTEEEFIEFEQLAREELNNVQS